MTAMLREIGVAPYFVLANVYRGAIDRDFASAAVFNHAIIAIPMPADSKPLPASITHPRLGRLLLFDPTSPTTPFGLLPSYLQENRVVVIDGDQGDLFELPAHPPDANRFTRRGTLSLDADGTLSGTITESMSGSFAAVWRESLLSKSDAERKSTIDAELADHLAQFSMSALTFENLDDVGKDLVVHMTITAPSYAKKAGGLRLVRPRVIGAKSDWVLDLKDRKFGYESSGPSLEVDDIVIALPPSLKVDELPAAIDAKDASRRYTSASKIENGALHYHREYRVEKVFVPRDQLDDLNRVFAQIVADERASVVLKP